ncbi:anaerobic ribonucleoside-triphosphate reductase, partial [Selenomonadales bacterium OttesenSCG-928-I06]|nr:anaerobic ribonucleoside-triphosphate reductase [Selenomonadales bacterium OttesenSCG-928-I06]
NGEKVPFIPEKIAAAVYKSLFAVKEFSVPKNHDDESWAKNLAVSITKIVVDRLLMNKAKNNLTTAYNIEDIQNYVEDAIFDSGFKKTAKAYIQYRANRTAIRESRSALDEAVTEILKETHKENANVSNSPSAKMLQIGSAASKSYYLNKVINEKFANAHKSGDIHIHDLDFYGKTLTCLQIPLKKLLENGFNSGHGFIRPPKRASSAAALSCIILQSNQNDMHGGQSYAFYDRDLAPYFEDASEEETYQAMEAVIYNLNSMHSRAGAQVPFSSVNIGTDTSEGGRKVTRALLQAYYKGLGHGETPIFPNIIFKVKKGINKDPNDPNYDLFRLALEVASVRLFPTFSFMDASFNRIYNEDIGYMGCRTRVMANRCGPEVTDGRGNLSFSTVNLPRVALEAKGNMDKFWKGLERITVLTIEQLYERYVIQSNLKVFDMPFLMGQGLYLGSEKLSATDRIESAIIHGTLSLGFIGLAETLILLTGKDHSESAESLKLGEEIIARMRQLVDQAGISYNLNYTFLATPAEGIAGRFTTIDRAKYGEILNVTDKEFYTNSYHVPVYTEIDAFNKIQIEGRFHKYCNAGHISYVELAAPPNENVTVAEKLIDAMIEADFGYGGINFPLDHCKSCGFTAIIPNDDCPVCKDKNCIRRVRRITGYLSTVDRFNSAKLAELNARKRHL